MYQIHQAPFGAFTKYTVSDEQSGNGFSIAPAAGATVLDIWMDHQSILDGYQTPDELSAAKWGKSAVLFPFPNRLRDGRYDWEGVSYEFPINNAPTGNAIHGFVRTLPFEVSDTTANESSGSITVLCRYDGRFNYYPFPFDLELTFAIENNQQFTLEVEVHNRHTTAIPMGFGWHPYFRLTESADDSSLHLPACQQVVIDERMIPTGALNPFDTFERPTQIGDAFLDNCFLAPSDYTLSLIGAGRAVHVQAALAEFPYFQVFTPPHRNSVALEPMSCNVDAFHNGDGLVTLGPGANWSGGMFVRTAKK